MHFFWGGRKRVVLVVVVLVVIVYLGKISLITRIHKKNQYFSIILLQRMESPGNKIVQCFNLKKKKLH